MPQLAAAELGHAGAQLAVADLYRTGRGVERDPIAAWVWFDIAAGRLRDEADRAAAGARRDALAAVMTAEQAAAARDRVAAKRQDGVRAAQPDAGSGATIRPSAL